MANAPLTPPASAEASPKRSQSPTPISKTNPMPEVGNSESTPEQVSPICDSSGRTHLAHHSASQNEPNPRSLEASWELRSWRVGRFHREKLGFLRRVGRVKRAPPQFRKAGGARFTRPTLRMISIVSRVTKYPHQLRNSYSDLESPIIPISPKSISRPHRMIREAKPAPIARTGPAPRKKPASEAHSQEPSDAPGSGRLAPRGLD